MSTETGADLITARRVLMTSANNVQVDLDELIISVATLAAYATPLGQLSQVNQVSFYLYKAQEALQPLLGNAQPEEA